MQNYTLRAYIQPDAQAVVDVINTSFMQTIGFARTVVDAVGNVWSHRYVPFSSEKVVAVNEQGQVVGYAYFASGDNHILAETGASSCQLSLK